MFGAGEDAAERELVNHTFFGSGGEFPFACKDLSLSLFVLADFEALLAQIFLQDGDDFGDHSRIGPQFFRQIDSEISVQNGATLKRRARADADQSQVVQRGDHRVDFVALEFFDGFVESGQFPRVARFILGQLNDFISFVFIGIVLLGTSSANPSDVEAADLQQVGFGPVREFRRDIEARTDHVDFVFANLADVAFVFAPFDFVADDDIGERGFLLGDGDPRAAPFGRGIFIVQRIDHAVTFVLGLAARRQRTAFQTDH